MYMEGRTSRNIYGLSKDSVISTLVIPENDNVHKKSNSDLSEASPSNQPIVLLQKKPQKYLFSSAV